MTVVAWADSEADYRQVVSRAMQDYELQLVDITEVEPFEVRLASHRVDAVLVRDAERVPSDTAYVFGDFHVYPLD